MGNGRGGPSENFLQVVVIIINFICGILGGLIFSLGMWMRFETDVKDWVRELGIYEYWTGLYILMIAGIIIMIISTIGCCGAFMGNPCLLLTNLSLTSLTFVLLVFGSGILLAKAISPSIDPVTLKHGFDTIFARRDFRTDTFVTFLWYRSSIVVIVALILELTGAIFILVNGTENGALQSSLDTRFNRLMIDANYDNRANRFLQAIQEKVGCCGSNNYQDYTRLNLPVSDYCRDFVSGNIYPQGCVQQVAIFIEKRAGWIAGIALFVGFLQMFLVCASIAHYRNMRDDEAGTGENKRYTEVSQRTY